MKSLKSTQYEQSNVNNNKKKPKIITSRTSTQNIIIPKQITSKASFTNLFLKKHLSALREYHNLFSDTVHIGDADSVFKKSLRQYNEFNYLKNTSWIKPKGPYTTNHSHSHHHIHVAQAKKAAGDHQRHNKTLRRKRTKTDLVESKDNLKSSQYSLEQNSTSSINETVLSLNSVKESETFDKEPVISEQSSSTSLKNKSIVVKVLSETSIRAKVLETLDNYRDLTESSEELTELIPEALEVETEVVETQLEPEVEVPETVLETEDNNNDTYRSDNSELFKMAEDGRKDDLNEKAFKSLVDQSLQDMKNAVDRLNQDADVIATDVAGDMKQIKGTGRAQGDGKGTVVPLADAKVLVELEEAEKEARETSIIISQIRDRLAELLNKDHMTDAEAKELEEMNQKLIQHMETFEAKTKLIQALVQFADQHLKPGYGRQPRRVKRPEDMLPKVIICGTTDNNMPKIIICDGDKKIKSKSPTRKDKAHGDVVPHFAKRLSQSYEMQEKLAADNVDLEGKRFQLHEELLNKDQTCETLQRKVCSLQTEMRILNKENCALSEKLKSCQGKCRPRADMPCGAARGVCPADVENRLQHYSQQTTQLEKQVETMEGDVRRMQEELVQCQRERNELEKERLRLLQQPPPPPPPPPHVCRPSCLGPCRPGAAAEQQLRELREQYNRLQDDYKAKVTEVAGLRADNEKLKCTCNDLDQAKRQALSKTTELENQMKKYDAEKSKMLGSKEQYIEQEQQLTVAKQRFREAQDELEELRALIGEQASQLEDYRNKYLQAQQQVEEQRRQIDMMEMENNRVSEQVTVEIQRVKNQFQEKLAELSPLPDILKSAQLKLQEEQQLRVMADRNSEQLSRELQMYKDKAQAMLSQMEKVRSDQMLSEDERAAMQSKLTGWECKCNDMQQNCDKLKTDLVRAEEIVSQIEKRLDEKLHEVAQLTAQLETVREESARQVARIKDRCETVRRSMQGQIAELERQLAQARAVARSAQKDRDEIRQRMQQQINNLNENFEEAQMRIRSLQGHVNFLKTSYTNMYPGADGGTQQNDDGCDCGGGNY